MTKRYNEHMEGHTILHYLREINSLIEQSKMAYYLIFQTVKGMRGTTDSDTFFLEKEKVWMYIMTFLALFGNVSKLLFPVKRDGSIAIQRGNELRHLIKIDRSSIISNRKLRDDFEHFDARLDSYFQSERKHMLIDKNIGDPSEYKGVQIGEFLRHFHPEESLIIFSGKEYYLSTMMDALNTINNRVIVELSPIFRAPQNNI